jgi:predicted small secreted protein
MAHPPARAIRLRVRPRHLPLDEPDPILSTRGAEGYPAMSNSRPIFLTVLSALVLCGCNTIAGMGRDIESVGDTVEDAAT